MRGLAAAAAAIALALSAGAHSQEAPAPAGEGDLAAFFDCLRMQGASIPSAHRAAPTPDWAENSLEGIVASGATGAILVEVDVRASLEGKLVLMHDETLERTTTRTGRVDETSIATLIRTRLRGPQGREAKLTAIPTLREALFAASAQAVLQLDVKRGTPFDTVVREVRAARAQDRVVVIVYSLEEAVAVHRLDPSLMLSVSIDEMADVEALQAAGVDLSRVLAFTGTRAPNPALYAALNAAGIEVIFGTLGAPGARLDDTYTADDYRALTAMGVQVIATDRSADVADILDASDGVIGPAWRTCSR
jgi:glycerophosphoryl diester phosphodiesterase